MTFDWLSSHLWLVIFRGYLAAAVVLVQIIVVKVGGLLVPMAMMAITTLAFIDQIVRQQLKAHYLYLFVLFTPSLTF